MTAETPDIDQVALEAARQFTADNNPQGRAQMQCDIVAAIRRSQSHHDGKPEDGYRAAFFELGDMLGLSAQPHSPKQVWEEQMRPMLKNLVVLNGNYAKHFRHVLQAATAEEELKACKALAKAVNDDFDTAMGVDTVNMVDMVPAGWVIERTKHGLRIVAPHDGPGWIHMSQPGNSLVSRLLYALAAATAGKAVRNG